MAFKATWRKYVTYTSARGHIDDTKKKKSRKASEMEVKIQ